MLRCTLNTMSTVDFIWPAMGATTNLALKTNLSVPFLQVLFAGLTLGLSLVYFVTARSSLPMNSATRISLLLVAFAPVLLVAVGNVLLQRAEGTRR